jgi:hypothetical protein
MPLKLHTLHLGSHHLNVFFVTQAYSDLKFCPSILEIVSLRVPVGISETLCFSVSAPHLKFVPLLDVHQLLMFARTLMYSQPGMFFSIIYYVIIIICMLSYNTASVV